MVEAEPNGQALVGDSLVEHTAEGLAVHGSRLVPEADNAAAKLIHHHQDPVRLEQDRLSPE